jgi:hypothetical protein
MAGLFWTVTGLQGVGSVFILIKAVFIGAGALIGLAMARDTVENTINWILAGALVGPILILPAVVYTYFYRSFSDEPS